MRVKELPPSERPRERLEAFGPKALSTQELLAIALGSGHSGFSVLELARQMVSTFGDLRILFSADRESLLKLKGVGPAKASMIHAIFELALRLAEELPREKSLSLTPKGVADRLIRLTFLEREVVVVLLRNSAGQIIQELQIGEGTLDSVIIHPRELLKMAIRYNAKSLIIAHNHPSGEPTPSIADLEVTYRVQSAGSLLDLPLDDHLIVGRGGYFSFWEAGILSASRNIY